MTPVSSIPSETRSTEQSSPVSAAAPPVSMPGSSESTGPLDPSRVGAAPSGSEAVAQAAAGVLTEKTPLHWGEIVEFHERCREGNLASVRAILDGKSVSQGYLASVVIEASAYGHEAVVRFLLSEGRTISQEDLGLAVCYVSLNGHEAIVRFLLSEGRTISQEDLGQAVRYPSQNGHEAVVRFLLSEGRTISQGDLGQAVRKASLKGHEAIVRFLLSEGRTISQEDLGSAFHVASGHGHEAIARFLLSEGRTISHESLLSFYGSALYYGHQQIAEFLKLKINESFEFISDEIIESISKTQEIKEDEKDLIKLIFSSVARYPNYKILVNLSKLLVNSLSFENIQKLMELKDSGWTDAQIKKVILPLILMVKYFPDDEITTLFKQHYKHFKDFRNIQTLLQLQIALATSTLEEKRIFILRSLLKIEDHKEIITLMGIVTAILAIDPEKLNEIEADGWTIEKLVKVVSDQLVKDGYLPEEGCLPFIQSRNPKALFDYCSNHTSKEMKEVILYFTTSVVDGSFQSRRNANNSHATYLSEHQKEVWEKALEIRDCASSEKAVFDVGLFLRQKLVTDKHAEGLIRDDFLDYEAEPEGGVAAGPFNPIEKAVFELKMAKKEEVLDKLNALKECLKDERCEFKNDIDAQISLMTRGHSTKSYQLVDSDDPFDLFLCGTDVLGSCQRVDGDPNLNKCLMGYVLDGKSRLLLVKDPEIGQIISRAILKILIDEDDKPHLFFERIYGNPAFAKQLKELAKEKADKMGVELYDEGTEKRLSSKGNFAKLEYEDARIGVTDGEFTVQVKKIS